MVEGQSVLKHEACLGQRTFGGVDEQQNAVDHFKHALDFAAEIGVAGGVDNVYFYAFIVYRSVLGKNGDASLTLDGAGIHDALACRLVFTVNAALLEHLVDEGRLAVVDVGNDGYVS
jgi:hypothetical protein